MISESITKEIQDKLRNHYYSIGFENVGIEKREEKAAAVKERFRKDLFIYMQTVLGNDVTQEQFESVFSYAWEIGHSSGFKNLYEVWFCYVKVIELITKFAGRTRI